MKDKFSLRIFLLSLFLLICIFSSSIVLGAQNTNTRKHKIVSVVYDDSGSMLKTDEGVKVRNWAYTNYAMQAYLALLNNEDQIFITFMSNPEEYQPYADIGVQRQAYIDSIRNDHWGSPTTWTPIESIKTAALALKDNISTDPNIEYYLVIFTDGEFDVNKTPQSAKELSDYIEENTKELWYTGKNLNISYFAIGQEAIEPLTDSISAKTEILRANTESPEEIVSAINDIADKTSNRYQFQDSQVTIEGNRLTINSKLPLLNIGILLQNSNAAITATSNPDNTQINIERTSIQGPVHEDYESDPNLMGTTFLLTEANHHSIPSGDVTIEFSEPIQKENIRVMYEPAIALSLSVLKDGQEVTDLESLRSGDEIQIVTQVFESGTDIEISPDSLEGYDLRVEGSETVNDKKVPVQFDSDNTYTLTKNPLEIQANLSSENTDTGNYFSVDESVSISPIPYELHALNVENLKDLDIRDLNNEETYIEYYMTAGGKALSKEEQEDTEIFITLSNKKIKTKTEVNPENGNLILRFKVSRWSLLTLEPQELTITANSLANTQVVNTINLLEYSFADKVKDNLGWILITALILICVIGGKLKPRFAKDYYVLSEIFNLDPANNKLTYTTPEGVKFAHKLRRFSFKRSLIPFIGQRIRICNVIFIARRKSNIVKCEIKNTTTNWYTGGDVSIDHLIPGMDTYSIDLPDTINQITNFKMDILLTPSTSLIEEIHEGKQYRVYYYFKETKKKT